MLGISFDINPPDNPNDLGSSFYTSNDLGLSFEADLGLSFEAERTTNDLGDSFMEDSLNQFSEHEWSTPFADERHGPLASTPYKARRELRFDTVGPKTKKQKSLDSYLCKEVKGGRRMKAKALDPEDIKQTLNEKCFCGQKCLRKVTFSDIKNERLGYWTQTGPVKRHTLKLYVKRSTVCGRYRYFGILENMRVCAKAFMKIKRIHKNSLTRALEAVELDLDNTPGRCPKKKIEKSLQTINWLEDYASGYGDRMPHTDHVLLPYKYKKVLVYKKYMSECRNPVSDSQFYKIWRDYFPHLRIKKTNSFSKCSTCTLLEKQRENAPDHETRAKYGQLKDGHHERQQMERRYYYGKRDASRKSPLKCMSMIIDGMDQAKTNLPHFSGRLSKDVNPSDLLKTHVTGVINHGVGGFHTYVDINEYPHDPNLTINILLRALKKAAEALDNTLPPILYIQADNCGRENKNKFVMAFLELLVQLNIFREAHISFLYVGHTHEDIDAAFSKVHDALKGEDVETLPRLMELLKDSEEVGKLYDVKQWMEPYLAEVTGISSPLHFKFTKEMERVTKMSYKGPHYTEWIRVEEPLLSKIPGGIPKIVKPDYSKINIEKGVKQVKKVKNLFKNLNSINYWETFYNQIETRKRHVPNWEWILDKLPRQQEEEDIEILVSQDVQNRITKETSVAQPVNVRRKKKQQPRGRQTDPRGMPQNTNTTKQKRPRGQQRRGRIPIRRVMLIPLTDEVKRHIWLFIFYCLLETILFIFDICFLILFLYDVYMVIQYLRTLFMTLVIVHTGAISAHRFSHCSFMFSASGVLVH